METLECDVIEVSRGTTHDGPGVRTTVFVKGCPLKCAWCQNPEGMNAGRAEVWWEKRKCIRCMACRNACPSAALDEDPGGLRRNRETCTRCGACVEVCPSRAMSFVSRKWSLDALVKEALKDREYYQALGGGVTVSGGEPLGQYRFVAEFFRRLHDAGVRTALDTCGLAPEGAFTAVLPHTDHVLFDIKLLDDGLHQAYTGQTNTAILANLALIAGQVRSRAVTSRGMKLWIRTPLIPGATATRENIAAIGRLIRDCFADVVDRWELCAFNGACRGKYEKLGLAWSYADTPLMDQGAVAAVRDAALSAGVRGDKLVVSGLIAKG